MTPTTNKITKGDYPSILKTLDQADQQFTTIVLELKEIVKKTRKKKTDARIFDDHLTER